MKGVVRQLEPILQLIVFGQHQQRWLIDAVIDTGATCELTLPADVIRSLGLKWYERSEVILADNQVTVSNVFEMTILWHGDKRSVRVHEAEGSPLVGMKLLAGSQLIMEVVNNGAVELFPLFDHLEEQEE